MESEKQKRGANVSLRQKEVLVQFMTDNEDLRIGKFSNSFTKKIGQRLWEEVVLQLNNMDGATKTWIGWRKCWQDISSKVKTKVARINKYCRGTGGGGKCPEELTAIEEKIFSLLSKIAVGGHKTLESNIPILSKDTVTIVPIPAIEELRNFNIPTTSLIDLGCDGPSINGRSANNTVKNINGVIISANQLSVGMSSLKSGISTPQLALKDLAFDVDKNSILQNNIAPNVVTSDYGELRPVENSIITQMNLESGAVNFIQKGICDVPSIGNKDLHDVNEESTDFQSMEIPSTFTNVAIESRKKNKKAGKKCFKQNMTPAQRLDNVIKTSGDLLSLSSAKMRTKNLYFNRKIINMNGILSEKEKENKIKSEKLKLYIRDIEAKEEIAKELKALKEVINNNLNERKPFVKL